jgi:hypothetical protein
MLKNRVELYKPNWQSHQGENVGNMRDLQTQGSQTGRHPDLVAERDSEPLLEAGVTPTMSRPGNR